MEIKEFLDLTKKKGIDETQINIISTSEIEIKTINERMKENSTNINETYNIMSKIKDKYVDISANYLSEDLVDLLLLKADNLEVNYEEEFVKEDIKGENLLKIDFNTKNELKELLKLNELRKEYPLIEYIEGYFGMVSEKNRIINTSGIDMSTESIEYILYISATSKKSELTESYSDVIYTTKKENIKIETLAKEVMSIAEKALEKQEIESKRYLTVLSSDFMSNILSRMIPLFSSEQIRKKSSCFEGKLNKRIFSDKVTIIEDPLNKDMPAYTLFDLDGTKTEKKHLIENGVLKTYLFNNKEAKLAKCNSTGNGYEGISVRNMYIKPGKRSKQEMISNIKEGLYIRQYQESGGTTVNPTTGIISVQVFGSIIKDGKIFKDFEPCVLTINLFDLFSNVVEIGNDLEYKTSITASPTIIVDNVSISSN